MQMPPETMIAVEWALKKVFDADGEQHPVVRDGRVNWHLLVDAVREYFDSHGIECPPMNAYHLMPYVPEHLRDLAK